MSWMREGSCGKHEYLVIPHFPVFDFNLNACNPFKILRVCLISKGKNNSIMCNSNNLAPLFSSWLYIISRDWTLTLQHCTTMLIPSKGRCESGWMLLRLLTSSGNFLSRDLVLACFGDAGNLFSQREILTIPITYGSRETPCCCPWRQNTESADQGEGR